MDEINDETCELIEAYTSQQGFLTFETTKNISQVLGSLFKWMTNMIEYHRQSKIVKPLQYTVAVQTSRLEIAEEELAQNEAKLKEAQARLDDLDAKNKKTEAELEIKVELFNKSQKKIREATKLIGLLDDEKKRWT